MSRCFGICRQGSSKHRYVPASFQQGGTPDTLGLLERENATILNASLLSYAAQVVAGFVDSVQQLELDCPLFLTSNDGTLMTCDQAVRFPIKTFSSGPTNSMRGANFLASWASGGPRKETALVVDVGGTTVNPLALDDMIKRPHSWDIS